MEQKKQLRRSERKIKKRDTSTGLVNDSVKSKTWTKNEKSQLLAALEMYDESEIGCISEMIPTKSSQQVIHYIRLLKRRASTVSNKIEEVKNLEKWAKLLSKTNKNSDVSTYDGITIPFFLISLFEDFPHPSFCDGIDFKAAYEFIFCIMAEIPPKPLNRKTMDFISKSFREMGQMVTENADLKKYIHKKLNEISPEGSKTIDFLNPLNIPEITLPLSFKDS